MRKFEDFLPSVKVWRFPAAFFIVSWVWQCANIITRTNSIVGTIALVLFGISLLCLTALLIIDSFPSPHREALLGNTLLLSITLSSALSVVLSAQGHSASDGDGAYRFSCLCLISLATPVVLKKLIKDVSPYTFVGSMACSLIGVSHSCYIQRSSAHTAHVVVCVLYTLCLLTCGDLDGRHEGAISSGATPGSRPEGAQKEQCAPLVGLVANAAHDLKTPLVSFMVGIDNALETLFNIKQTVELCDCKCSTKHSIMHLLSSAELCMSNCRRTNQFMLMIINRMMDSAKSARGLKLSPKYETISLLETIKLPLECVRNLKTEVLIVLEKIPDDICRYIITDKQWLQENLLALLTNAVKYSNGGTVVLRVLLECHNTKNSHQYLRFEVEDEGIGMTDEASESLFNPFQQNQRLAGGTGLGLFSLSKRTEALKGQCGVRKRPDDRQGSLFWFTIRYRPDESHLSPETSRGENMEEMRSWHSEGSQETEERGIFGAASAASEQSLRGIDRTGTNSISMPIPSSLSLGGESETTAVAAFDPNVDILPSLGEESNAIRKPCILLVDDTTSILKMTTMMLKMHDFDVTVAMNGAAALDIVDDRFSKISQQDLYSDKPFDVILMDLQMPIMDGIEATKRLRRWELDGVTGRGVDIQHQKRLKIIGLSANNDEEVLEETRKAGFDGFIPKPFTVKSLRPFLD